MSNLKLLIAALPALALLMPAPGYATAGQVFFRGTVTTVGSAVGNPGQVALDHQGNLWAVSNLHNSVVEWNGTSWTTVISGLSSPYGLAFDSSDNLYVSQTGTPAVYKYAAPGYSSGTLLTPTFSSPVYLAFDANNNLFVADSGNNAVYELLASGSYATKTAVVSSGLSSPSGVALDLSGNLFVADTSNGDVKMYTASSSYATATTIATSLDSPMGISVDPGGNVYVSELSNGKLDLITAKSGYTLLEAIYTEALMFGARGVVVGPGGVVYESPASGPITEINPAVNMGTSAVGSAAVIVTVTFDFVGLAPTFEPFNVGFTGVHTNVVTTGETVHDFTINNNDAGTCGGTTASYSFTGGDICTVKVQFAATAPGVRTGAVELLNGSGVILATGFVYGTGTAPLAAFSPGSVSPVLMGALSPALTAPSNPAWRVDGNLFFTDGTSTGRLIEISPGSGSPTVVSTGDYTIQNPKGVAIDGAGNIFVSDAGNNRVLRVSFSGAATIAIPTGYGIGNMGQVAVDAAGNVYVADGANSRIVVAPPTGDVYTLPISGVDLDTPAGVAVDGNFNVYIADSGSNKIYQVSNGMGSTVDTSSLATALNAPSSLTIDDNGTLYVSDTGNNRIVLIPASGAPSVLAYDYTTALSSPQGVVFDLAGQMYIADSGNNAIMQYDWTSAEYGFADTSVGSLSSDSPASFTFFNLGNSALTIAIPGSGNNPSITNSAFSLGTGTTCPQLTASTPGLKTAYTEPGTLNPLASCTLTFNFQPTASGPAFDEVSYLNNSLNVTGTYSVVALFGTGVPPGDTTTVTFAMLPSSLYSGQSATVSVTVADTTTPASIPTGSVSFTDSIQGSLGSATINGSGVASLGSITFTGAGTHIITASYAGVSATFAASSNTASVTVGNAAAATFNTPPPTLNFGTVPVGQTSSTGTVTFTFATTGVIGQPKVLTLGKSGKGSPFQPVTGGSCEEYGANTVWIAASTCSMLVSFSPNYPGMALGAVEMVDLSGNVLSTAYITAIGTGPEAVTLPGTVTSVTATGSYRSTWAMAFDGAGNLYFADFTGNQVFEVPPGGGAVTLIAGTGTAGSSGDGGAATSAQIYRPADVAVDGAGNLYIADYGNNLVRMVSAASGIITTVAGNGTQAYTGDGGAATSAALNGPGSLALDGAGNLYIADLHNNVIREVTAATGVISTVAGNGTQGFSGDGGLATSAQLNLPNSVALDGAGNLYITDENNNCVRMVSATSGNISTVAGNGSSSDSGDGGLATQAGLSGPVSVAVDAAGNLTIADGSGSIRMVFAASGIIETNSVNLGVPFALREDGAGNLYAANTFVGGLNIVSPTTSFTYPATTAVGSSDTIDGAMTALLVNIGNTTLTAAMPGLTAPADFAQVAGSGTPADCTAAFSMAAGAVCTLNLEFEPTAAGSPLTESFVITDNSLNNESTTQSIGLTGTALPVQATLTVTGVPNTAQPYGTTFTVGSAGGSGNGAVTFTASGACSVSGITVTITAGSGTCSVAATKASDGTYAAATSAAATVAATLATEATLTVTGVPITAQPYGTTFTVGSAGGSGTGAVTFNASGACSVSGTTVTITAGSGTCSVTATKASDGNYASATSAAATVAAVLATQATLTVTGVPNTAQTFGTTFTVGSAGGSGSGEVTFNASGACSVSGTTVTITANSGTCSVTATKASDGNYASATSAAATVPAGLTPEATLSVTGVPNSAQPYGTTFTVGSVGGSGTGAVTFNASGACSVSGTTVTMTAGLGTCSVTATKASDGTYASATSAAVTVGATLASQTISFTAPASPVNVGVSPITLVASGGSSGNAVTFAITGPATLSGSALTITGVGTVTITANQAGNANYQAAPAVTHTIVVNREPSAISLISNANPVLITNPITFTAEVAETLAQIRVQKRARGKEVKSKADTPAGSVAFFDGTTLLGTVTLSSGGTASFTTSSLAAGTHAITAVFNGDSTFTSATSSAVDEVVQDYTLTASPTAGGGGSGSVPSQTVAPGGTATYALALGPTNGTTFPVPVSLSLSGLPPGATGTLTPNTLPAGSSLTNVTLTIQLPQVTASLHRKQPPNGGIPPTLWGILLLPFAGRLRRAGKKLSRTCCLLLMLAAAITATVGLSGCGAGNGFFGQEQGTYTVRVTGTAGAAVSHSTTVSLTVE